MNTVVVGSILSPEFHKKLGYLLTKCWSSFFVLITVTVQVRRSTDNKLAVGMALFRYVY